MTNEKPSEQPGPEPKFAIVHKELIKEIVVYRMKIRVKDKVAEFDVSLSSGKYLFNEEIGTHEKEKLTPEEMEEFEQMLKNF